MDVVYYNSLIHGLLNSHQWEEESGFLKWRVGKLYGNYKLFVIYWLLICFVQKGSLVNKDV